jgi:hypothetical protein
MTGFVDLDETGRLKVEHRGVPALASVVGGGGRDTVRGTRPERV